MISIAYKFQIIVNKTFVNGHMPSSTAKTGIAWKVKSATISAHRNILNFIGDLSFIGDLAKM